MMYNLRFTTNHTLSLFTSALRLFHNWNINLNFRSHVSSFFVVHFVIKFAFSVFIARLRKPGMVDILPGSLNGIRELWSHAGDGRYRKHRIGSCWNLSLEEF